MKKTSTAPLLADGLTEAHFGASNPEGKGN